MYKDVRGSEHASACDALSFSVLHVLVDGLSRPAQNNWVYTLLGFPATAVTEADLDAVVLRPIVQHGGGVVKSCLHAILELLVGLEKDDRDASDRNSVALIETHPRLAAQCYKVCWGITVECETNNDTNVFPFPGQTLKPEQQPLFSGPLPHGQESRQQPPYAAVPAGAHQLFSNCPWKRRGFRLTKYITASFSLQELRRLGRPPIPQVAEAYQAPTLHCQAWLLQLLALELYTGASAPRPIHLAILKQLFSEMTSADAEAAMDQRPDGSRASRRRSMLVLSNVSLAQEEVVAPQLTVLPLAHVSSLFEQCRKQPPANYVDEPAWCDVKELHQVLSANLAAGHYLPREEAKGDIDSVCWEAECG